MTCERAAAGTSGNSGCRDGHIARAPARTPAQNLPRMNDLFAMLGLQSWKPILSALLLPPVPLLLLMLVGARMMYWRRTVSWLVILTGATGTPSCRTNGRRGRRSGDRPG